MTLIPLCSHLLVLCKTHIHPPPPSLFICSWVFRMKAGCVGVAEDSSSTRQQQSWRWRALRSQPLWTWTRVWLWPASPSFACCWWPWSSAVPRSSWTPTALSPPPHGRNSTWTTEWCTCLPPCCYAWQNPHPDKRAKMPLLSFHFLCLRKLASKTIW